MAGGDEYALRTMGIGAQAVLGTVNAIVDLEALVQKTAREAFSSEVHRLQDDAAQAISEQILHKVRIG